jgi:AP endonuclease-1
MGKISVSSKSGASSKKTTGTRKTADKNKTASEKEETSREGEGKDPTTEPKLNVDLDLNGMTTHKIVSWNVAGIRSCVMKGCVEYLEHENADIICLQELKVPSEDEIPHEVKLEGYHKYWSVGKGQPGVGILSKQLPISVTRDLPGKFENEKRLITADYEDFYLVCCYVVNAGRGLKTLKKRLEWNDAFDAYIQELDKEKPVIIAGDLNVAHDEIDLANPKSNHKNAGFTKAERDGFSKLLSYDFIDTFRDKHPNEDSAYTFWSYMNK